MTNLNARINPAKYEHIHVRDKEVAIRIICAICHREHLYHDVDLSKRAGYAVYSVRLDEHDPKSETATIDDLGTRYEVNDHTTGRTTCIWYD